MKRTFSLMLAMMLLICCTCMYAFSSGETDAPTLGEITSGAGTVESEQQTQAGTEKQASRAERDQKFISGLNEASDLTADIEGTKEATEWLRVIASWIVQVVSYGITAFLAVRVVLDLAYISLPFLRGILANGYVGNAQAGAGGIPNSMAGGMNGMAGGMNGMNGMMNRGMMNGGYGMNRMNSMAGGMNGMPGGANMNDQGSMIGRIQWVSNAALNAVSSESTVGPDGKANSPFKTYIKDMVIVLVTVPVLLILAATGALTSLGFFLGGLLCDVIANIGNMM